MGPGPTKPKGRGEGPRKRFRLKKHLFRWIERSILFGFLKDFLNFLSPKITIKAIFFWALYLYIVKFIDIKNIDINNLSISNFNFNDVLNFLLRKELPLVSCKG